MIYLLAALVPPLGLLLNGQPFSAIFNVVLLVICLVLGLFFHFLLLVPSAHAVIAVHMRREERRHREMVEAIRRHGPPPGYPRSIRPLRPCNEKAVYGALIRHSTMLSTSVNPTDGPRFDGGTAILPTAMFIPKRINGGPKGCRKRSWRWRRDFKAFAKPTRSTMCC